MAHSRKLSLDSNIEISTSNGNGTTQSRPLHGSFNEDAEMAPTSTTPRDNGSTSESRDKDTLKPQWKTETSKTKIWRMTSDTAVQQRVSLGYLYYLMIVFQISGTDKESLVV